MNQNFRYAIEEPLITEDGLELLRHLMRCPIDDAERLVEDELFEDFDSLDLMP